MDCATPQQAQQRWQPCKNRMQAVVSACVTLAPQTLQLVHTHKTQVSPEDQQQLAGAFTDDGNTGFTAETLFEHYLL